MGALTVTGLTFKPRIIIAFRTDVVSYGTYSFLLYNEDFKNSNGESLTFSISGRGSWSSEEDGSASAFKANAEEGYVGDTGFRIAAPGENTYYWYAWE